MDARDPFVELGAFAEKRPRVVVAILAFLFICVLLISVVQHVLHKNKNHEMPTPVQVISAKIADVPIYLSALGTVSPDATVSVRTQINGTLLDVPVQDGQFVKKGDVLAHIDARPYEATLQQSEGALLRDQALLDNATIDLKRYQNLYRTKSVSQQTVATQESLVHQYEGAVKIDQGQIALAKTNLAYCTIASPVSGRIGIVTIDPGNLVQTSDANPIAVVTTLDPVDIIFPLPERNVPMVAIPFEAKKTLPVTAYDQDFQKVIGMGVLKAIDNQVNLATGTVNFKAEFANPKNTLFPNQFVNVKLLVDTLHHVVVVPTTAIQEGAEGAYVYRYNVNHTVSLVPVKTGENYNGNTIILSGIAVNQMVVTQGADKLFNNAKVLIK